MKKTFIAASVLGTLISADSFAKTEGNFIGLDLVNTESQMVDVTNGQQHREDDFGFGINYQHAFNFNGFFVAPEIFYDSNRNLGRANGNSDELLYSYGLKANLGYDITDKIALFAVLGGGQARSQSNLSNVVEDRTDEFFTYGLGAAYEINDKFAINIGYEISQYTNSKDPLTDTTDSFNSDFKVARVGVTYNF